MFKWKPETRVTSLLLTSALLVALGAAGCGSGSSVTPTATKQGTVNLEALKVGMPETTIKEAILTFVPDPKGSIAGKNQYLSRTPNANGGQVIAQCKDNQVFGLQIYHQNKPVGKEVAIASLKQLLPSDVPPQSKVDDAGLKSAIPVEVYWFGDDYRGELFYTDATGSQVKILSVWYEPKGAATTTSEGGDQPAAGADKSKAEAPAGDG